MPNQMCSKDLILQDNEGLGEMRTQRGGMGTERDGDREKCIHVEKAKAGHWGVFCSPPYCPEAAFFAELEPHNFG